MSREDISVEQVKNRLPFEFAEQVFNKSDALTQISNLKTQYNNERVFADEAVSILNALKNTITDSYLIHQIENLIESRVY